MSEMLKSMDRYAAARAAAAADDQRMTPAQRAELSAWLVANGLPADVTLLRLRDAPDALDRTQRAWIAAFRARLT